MPFIRKGAALPNPTKPHSNMPAIQWSTATGPAKPQSRAIVVAYNSDIVADLNLKLDIPVTHPATPQQEAFIYALQHSTDNMLLSARAGTGKTSTIRMAVQACNQKAIARTVHSVGMSVWMKRNSGAIIERNKVRNILDSWEDAHKTYSSTLTRVGRSFITRLVDQAKQSGVGMLMKNEPESYVELVETYGLDMAHSELYTRTKSISQDFEFAINLAQTILNKSDEMTSQIIDFNDQLRAPLLANIPDNQWPQYDMVYVDEAQDISALRSMIIKKLSSNGRTVLVGDPYQAIYAFSGAMSDALSNMQRAYHAELYPLTVTHRCPKSVVELAKQWVPDFEAHSSAPEGTVTTIDHKDWNLDTLTKDDVILCRNNRPLMDLAFKFINQNTPVRFEGKDIAGMINSYLTKWAGITTNAALKNKLAEYEDKQTKVLIEKHKEHQANELKERIALVYTVLDGCINRGIKHIEGTKQFITNLFGDTKANDVQTRLTLTSVHKSKGKEWKRVFLLGRNIYMPAQRVLANGTPEMLQQEYNLMYVAVTRAMDSLIEIRIPKEKKQKNHSPKEIEYGW